MVSDINLYYRKIAAEDVNRNEQEHSFTFLYHQQKEYILQLISKVENVTKRMRWKALQFLGKLDTNNKQTFGFRSPKCPPTVNELGSFEIDLQERISNIKFRPTRNKFLSKLNEDIKTIKNTNELLKNADKSSNIYKMTKEDYKKHLENSITKTYKKSNRNKIKTINRDAKKIAKKLEIDDRVEKLQEAEAFITIQFHKDGFPHALSFRLINPSKVDIGKISKSLLDTINKNILKESKFNQWKNLSDVVTWFKNIFYEL